MIRASLVLFLALACAHGQPDYKADANTIHIALPDGLAEFEWVTSASFRIARVWNPSASSPRPAATAEKIDYKVSSKPASLILESKFLIVEIDTPSLAVHVKDIEGTPVANDASGPVQRAGRITYERALASGERVYGLKTSRPNSLDIRGARSSEPFPFFLTSAGYGQRFDTLANYVTDVGQTAPDRIRVVIQGADRFEYHFFYGPTPKEILEQKRGVVKSMPDLPPGALLVLSPDRIPASAERVPNGSSCEVVRRLNEMSLSGVFHPIVDANGVDSTLAPMLPLIFTGSRDAELDRTRARWFRYLLAYQRETYDRGLPLIRPIAMQYPKDPGGDAKVFATLIGDEILAIPKCGAAQFKLPQGIWTDFSTGVRHSSRSTIELKEPVTILVRNGSLIPVSRNDALELRYYPKLGAEFFLYEPEIADYSQAHASPAGDFWRLEIESKVARRYDWVVYDIDPPKSVGETGRLYASVDEIAGPNQWRYDPRTRKLSIRLDARAGDGRIVNISF